MEDFVYPVLKTISVARCTKATTYIHYIGEELLKTMPLQVSLSGCSRESILNLKLIVKLLFLYTSDSNDLE